VILFFDIIIFFNTLSYSALVYWQEEYVGKNEIDDSDASPETKRKRAVGSLYLKLIFIFYLNLRK
jgi:hypothetical protein